MKTTSRIIVALLVMILLIPSNCLAVESQGTDATYNLTISYMDKDMPVEGAQIKAYYIGHARGANTIVLADEYKKFAPYIDIRVDALDEVAGALEGYIMMDKLEDTAVATGSIGSDGIVSFDSIKGGIYLVTSNNITIGDYCYQSQPSLISIPGAGGKSGSSEYYNTAVMKYKKLNCFIDDSVDISVAKVWKDEGNKKLRPKEITVQLFQDGQLYETVTLKKSNNWKYKWTLMDPTSKWTVAEKPVDGYTTKVEREGNSFYVTNTCKKPHKPDDPTEPTEPTDPTKPTNPDNPDKPHKLPQTGQLWWPVPVLFAGGLLALLIGVVNRRDENDE